MNFISKLVKGCVAGVIVWCIACIGTGLYLRPFIVLCGWPVALLHRVFPLTFADGIYECPWPKLSMISLIAWVIIAASAAALSHWISILRSRGRAPKS